MKTQSAKSKGRRLQQQVAADIVASFPDLEPDDARSTSMGCGGEDVQLSTAARRVFPFSVECKNCEKLALWSALGQCEANASSRAAPLLVFKRNRSDTYCALRWERLLELVRAAAAPAPAEAAAAPSRAASPRGSAKRRREALDEVCEALRGCADKVQRLAREGE